MYLERINGPEDIKKLNVDELKVLSSEVRDAVINRISKIGGHQGPNLGVVELTVALHYVFSSPVDEFVFDVSHQCYPHKILTGRKDAFTDDNHFRDVTGYTNPKESVHDKFLVGHTSTSISLALGLAKARDLKKEKRNVIAIIGDGSLSGGQAFEALDYAGEYDKNLIIVVNDNDQSIAENHGGLYKTLKELRENNGECENNYFKSLGLDYVYCDDGNDVEVLIKELKKIKDIDHPIVFHVHTIKGKGLAYAEKEKERFHAGGPFNIEDGTPKYKGNEDNYIRDSLIKILEEDPASLLVNAATPGGLGFDDQIRKKYRDRGQFIDVGIAEENGVSLVGAASRGGANAIFATFAPFFQRTYDQMSHDTCLNDSPATYLILSPGVYGMNSATHIALCDIQMFSHIPNLIYLAPAYKEEYLAMLEYASKQKEHPIAIRVPRLTYSNKKDETDYSIRNRYKMEQFGEDVAIIAVGELVPLAMEVAKKIKKETGKEITVINPHFLSGYDELALGFLYNTHHHVITIESGEKFGGFGSNISSFFADSNVKVINLGLGKEFYNDFKADELLDQCGISLDKLFNLTKNLLEIKK